MLLFQDFTNTQVKLSFEPDQFERESHHVLVIVRKGPKFLLTKHSTRGYEFPGGKRKGGESLEDAALREVYEETAIQIQNLTWLASYEVQRDEPFVKTVFLADFKKADHFDALHETTAREWMTLRDIERHPFLSFYMKDDGMEAILTQLKKKFPLYKKHRIPSPNSKVRIHEVTYYSDEFLVKGWLAEPVAGAQEAIVYLRGGINQIGKVRGARIAQIAAQGFTVFAPHYRGSFGGEGKDEFVGADRQDAYGAVDYLAAFGYTRIHLFAFSRGGIMALWAAVMRPEVTSLVTWGGVSSIYLTYEERVDMRRMMKRIYGGTPKKAPEAFEDRDVLQQLERMNAPVLIIHGELDTNVGFEHATILEEKLKGLNKPVTTRYLENHHHFVPDPLNRQILREALEWMLEQGR